MDYFYHVPEDEPNDYFQSYYDVHDESEETLGNTIYSMNWE